MTHTEDSVDVRAPISMVFDYVDAHANYPEMMHGFTDFEPTTPRHVVGTRLRMVGHLVGLSMPVEIETTEVVPNQRIGWRFLSGMVGQGQWRFEQRGKVVRVTTEVEYELPLGILGKIADKAVVEREIRINQQKTLENVRNRVEARMPASM